MRLRRSLRRPFQGGGLWLLAVLLLPLLGRAEQPLLGPYGLHGGRYVGLADPPRESLRLASSLGYAYTESVLGNDDRHQRVAGELYGAWLKWPALQLSVGSELRYDSHTTASSGSDSGVLAATRFTSRHAVRVHPRVSLAAQPSLIFPGAAKAAYGFRAATLELSALASYVVSPAASLGAMFGYRFDGTWRAVPDPLALSASDLLAASLSKHDAYLLGAIATFSLWSLKAAVELGWDIPTGGPLRAIESPMRLRAALQKQVSQRFVPGIELGFDASARPPFEAGVRIEPRVWARVGVSVLLDASVPAPAPRTPVRAASAAPATPKLVLSVVDERGWPLTGARVRATNGSGAQLCDEFGRLVLDVPGTGSELTIEADGFQPVRQRILPGASGVHTVTLNPRLPAGEIKGAVRNLAGQPLHARIELSPLELVTFSDAQGQFVIEVAPGEYTLRISAEGYESQDRPAWVEERGVTIVVVDLRKATP